ncbi:MAG: GNAT family N-acetyltransferase [Aggregatilineales bacterium]
MTISVERATLADAEKLVALQIAAFHHDSVLYPQVEISGPPGYQSVEVMREKITEAECYKIVDSGEIIGGIVLYIHKDDVYHLDLIFIDPAHHDRGIGTQAMNFLEKTYASAKKWTLDTPKWAIRNQHFYEKFGYVNVREFVEDDGTPLIAYEKIM